MRLYQCKLVVSINDITELLIAFAGTITAGNNTATMTPNYYIMGQLQCQHVNQLGISAKVVALFSAINFSSYIIELLQLHDTIQIK